MTDASAPDASALTRDALKAGGWEDMRPTYRELLRRLKQRDPRSFAEASRRFTSEVEPAILAGDEEPVVAWVAYGASIAASLGGGRLVLLDETGLATPGAAQAEPGHVLLFLPDASGDGAIPLAQPLEPSPAQSAALELLTR